VLGHLRILDLCDERGMFAGYLLAHLGAEVTVIEPPRGSPVRRMAPLAADTGTSLWWEAYARGKRSLVLDLESEVGRAELRGLAASADVVVESSPPGTMARLGLDYGSLSAANPGLVMASITPFGSTGPKAGWPATDLTVWAAAGPMAVTGDDDRAPVRTSVPQTWLHAGADAAGAILIALHERERSGLGQHIDVSAQQSAQQAALSTTLAIPIGAPPISRIAGGLRAAIPVQLTWPCADGYVAITLLFGPAFSAPNRRLLEWVHEQGACTREVVEQDWGMTIAAAILGQGEAKDAAVSAYLSLCKIIDAFTRPRRQADLVAEGLAHDVYIAPAANIPQLTGEPHFEARGYWDSVTPPGAAQPRRAPGAIAKLSATPVTPAGPAPALGTSRGSVASRPVPPRPDGPSDWPALAGLKVLDFTWVFAGPLATRVLADYGATVVKVESTRRLDAARPGAPAVGGVPGLENSSPFLSFNAGKKSITIDLNHPEGPGLARRLAAWADVLVESYTPGAMDAWGLGYDALKIANAGLVMLSTCLMGQSGPRSRVAGYGNMAAAFTGFYDLTGWPDRSPAGPYLAYTDGVSPRFMIATIMAALDHRRRTGEGQHIDLSQAEAALHFLAPAILAHSVNHETWTRMGNRDLNMAPNGVYPCANDDEWVAISCASDDQWPVLCRALALGELARDAALATTAGRLGRQDEIDLAISRSTAGMVGTEIQDLLIRAGIAAHVVQDSGRCATDPQLAHRGHFVQAAHPVHGRVAVEGSRFAFSRTPAVVSAAGPTLGQHNDEVLRDLLAMDDDEIITLVASGVLA
jgi:crotonobetainyl-CoA:carnitine CoA-transferase CaiB-like acyl-CoA transferase